MAEPEMPSRGETLRGMVLGLLPCAGDAADLTDGAAALRDAVVCWGRVLLRLAALAVLPVSLLVLYPIVRLEQRKRLEFELEREERRQRLIEKLTKGGPKPLAWPSTWPDPKTYGQVLSPNPQVVGRPVAHCACEACMPPDISKPETIRMILCAKCGSKRCPHATDHRNACTGSNEPGQKGSSWENYPRPGAHG